MYLCCVCGDGGLVLSVCAVLMETVDFLHHLGSPVYLCCVCGACRLSTSVTVLCVSAVLVEMVMNLSTSVIALHVSAV